MSFENNLEQEPTLNDFYVTRHFYLGKWTKEGNKDVEPSIVTGITKDVEDGMIPPKEGIARLKGIDDSRIER